MAVQLTWNLTAEKTLALVRCLNLSNAQDRQSFDKIKYDLDLAIKKEIENYQANPFRGGWNKVCGRFEITVEMEDGSVFQVQLGNPNAGFYFVQVIELGV